jgi:hypothetical protein
VSAGVEALDAPVQRIEDPELTLGAHREAGRSQRVLVVACRIAPQAELPERGAADSAHPDLFGEDRGRSHARARQVERGRVRGGGDLGGLPGQTSTTPRSRPWPSISTTSSRRWSGTSPGPPKTREYMPGGSRSTKPPSASAVALASRPMTETVAPAGAVLQPL